MLRGIGEDKRARHDLLQPVGDRLWLWDNDQDGRSAMGKWVDTIDGDSGACRLSSGVGTSGYCALHLTEKSVVSYQGYTQDHGGLIDLEHDHTSWVSICSSGGVNSLCDTWIPAKYHYDPSEGTLHDYCSKSPDQPPIDLPGLPLAIVDFRGPCARHDLCYAGDTAKKTCDDDFYARLRNQCDYTFPTADGLAGRIRSGCHGLAKTYYTAVQQLGNG